MKLRKAHDTPNKRVYKCALSFPKAIWFMLSTSIVYHINAPGINMGSEEVPGHKLFGHL